jgi:hypothetical protein
MTDTDNDYRPIRDWSDDEVVAYLEDLAAEAPGSFSDDQLDCLARQVATVARGLLANQRAIMELRAEVDSIRNV